MTKGERVPKNTVEDARIISIIYKDYPSAGIEQIILEKDGKQYYVIAEMGYMVAKTLPK